jgi:hypothetical protein
MSNVATILGNKIPGRLATLGNDDISRLNLRFEMLWAAFETMPIPGTEVVNNGDIMTKDDQVIFNTPAPQEVITVET